MNKLDWKINSVSLILQVYKFDILPTRLYTNHRKNFTSVFLPGIVLTELILKQTKLYKNKCQVFTVKNMCLSDSPNPQNQILWISRQWYFKYLAHILLFFIYSKFQLYISFSFDGIISMWLSLFIVTSLFYSYHSNCFSSFNLFPIVNSTNI